MTNDLAAFAKANGIKYFMISFTDLFGGQRAKLVPAEVIGEMQEEGAGFAGFAAYLDMTPAHPDMLAVPDPDSVVQLPWKPEVAWVASDCVMNDEPVAQAPRNTLKRLIADATGEGMRIKTGIEAEYFLTTMDGTQISDPYDTAAKPCYDQQAVMRRYDVIAEICDYMLQMGWGPYQKGIISKSNIPDHFLSGFGLPGAAGLKNALRKSCSDISGISYSRSISAFVGW